MSADAAAVTAVPEKVPANKAEKLYVPAVFITNLGNNIQLIAASLLAYRSTGTTLSVGWVFIAAAMPQVLLSRYFGKVADRFDRRALCVAADAISALIAAALPLWIFLGGNSDVGAYVVAFLLSAVASLYMPASNALMKERMDPRRIGKFSARYEMASNVGYLASAAVGGVAVQIFGVKPLFFFNALTFIVSALLTWSVGSRPPVEAEEEEEESGSAEPSAEQAAAVRAQRSRVLRFGMLFVVSSVVITVINTILLVLVIHKFKQGPGFLGVTDAVASIGFTLGAAHFGKLEERFDYRARILFGYVATGVIDILMPVSKFSLLPLIFAGGYTFGVGRLSTRTELMRSVDPKKTGRVFGTANAFGLGSALVATLVLSHVADTYSVTDSFTILGLLGIVPTVLIMATVIRTPSGGAVPGPAPVPVPGQLEPETVAEAAAETVAELESAAQPRSTT